MHRIMAIDYGAKRVGIALSDPFHTIASPHTVLENNAKLIKNLNEIIDEYFVGKIILGRPISLKGNETPTTKLIDDFYNIFKYKTDIEIEFVDERLSSKDAEEVLIMANVSRKKRKKVIDKLAAVIILQQYLAEKT